MSDALGEKHGLPCDGARALADPERSGGAERSRTNCERWRILNEAEETKPCGRGQRPAFWEIPGEVD
eukprot:scaffold67516_cov28-Tisochrysis_lutea.AAC.4